MLGSQKLIGLRKKLNGWVLKHSKLGGVINVMLFFHSIGVATPMLWKNNILKTLHL
jgi:hypothetical protein